ncbi:hypothetical protein [Mesorhizobium ventifaucium]|uniref:Uncharacterized protein n=1 Tax=Mesorhizobium ventifaucium TaxID=666020 RepID=A0ABN8JCR1_9HYPH|nr:hypothetical protein [Mesorhizobium ventifaucium]CAH2394519.1 conserved hypothetical protein [Mesorhizobium ventifaucium]
MKKGRKFLGGKTGRNEYDGRKRFQAGWEHDGWDFKDVVKAKFPKTGDESRAVKRERIRKALRYWARGQLRTWTADWEVYTPMVTEIDEMVKAKRPLAEIQRMVLNRVTARSFAVGTSEYQKHDGRHPGMGDSIEEIEDRFVPVNIPDDRKSVQKSEKELFGEVQEIIRDAQRGR